MRRVLGVAVAVLAGVLIPAATSGRAMQDDQAVRQLAESIVIEASRLPESSDTRLYEARLAFLLDASVLECVDLLQATRIAIRSEGMPQNGRTALSGLYDTLAACRRGTAAGSSTQGPSPFGPMLDFAAGGGSDYAS
jgi:hypothetical protein